MFHTTHTLTYTCDVRIKTRTCIFRNGTREDTAASTPTLSHAYTLNQRCETKSAEKSNWRSCASPYYKPNSAIRIRDIIPKKIGNAVKSWPIRWCCYHAQCTHRRTHTKVRWANERETSIRVYQHHHNHRYLLSLYAQTIFIMYYLIGIHQKELAMCNIYST